MVFYFLVQGDTILGIRLYIRLSNHLTYNTVATDGYTVFDIPVDSAESYLGLTVAGGFIKVGRKACYRKGYIECNYEKDGMYISEDEYNGILHPKVMDENNPYFYNLANFIKNGMLVNSRVKRRTLNKWTGMNDFMSRPETIMEIGLNTGRVLTEQNSYAVSSLEVV